MYEQTPILGFIGSQYKAIIIIIIIKGDFHLIRSTNTYLQKSHTIIKEKE